MNLVLDIAAKVKEVHCLQASLRNSGAAWLYMLDLLQAPGMLVGLAVVTDC